MTIFCWHVYMIRCRDNSLYTGVAIDVLKRFQEHASGKGARYTRAKGVKALVYEVALTSKSLAYRVEYRIKNLVKSRKELIVQEQWKQDALLGFLELEEMPDLRPKADKNCK